jgi:hypothetical protein
MSNSVYCMFFLLLVGTASCSAGPSPNAGSNTNSGTLLAEDASVEGAAKPGAACERDWLSELSLSGDCIEGGLFVSDICISGVAAKSAHWGCALSPEGKLYIIGLSSSQTATKQGWAFSSGPKTASFSDDQWARCEQGFLIKPGGAERTCK